MTPAPALSREQTRRLRLRAQGLERPAGAAADPAQIVRACVGLQAQDAAAAALSVRARGAGLTAAGVEQARTAAHTIVRTWAMRGTLHLVAAADVHWLLGLCGPAFSRPSRRHAELGLDAAVFARTLPLIRDLLAAQGPRTRAEIMDHLAGHGIPTAGQAAPHLLGRAALAGLLCYGPDREREPTYVLLDAWVAPPPALPREAALATLARRYLAAYGPARPDDLAAWSGLPRADVDAAWQAIAAEVREFAIPGGPAWLLATDAAWLDAPPPAAPQVCLLPAFDTCLLGYHSRAWTLAPEQARRIHPGGGILHPALLVDGQVLGTWRIARPRGRLEVVVTPFAALEPDVVAGLAAEVADVGRFLATEATWRLG